MSFVSYVDFEAKVVRCMKIAEQKFGVDMSRVQYRCDIRGKCGGRATKKYGRYGINFNKEAVRNYWDEMVDSTIPHEVAHLVCMMRPELERGAGSHGYGWRAVDRALGGDGARCHDMELTPTRRRKPDQPYLDSTGSIVQLTHLRHLKLQKYPEGMMSYTFRSTGGKITKAGWQGNKTRVATPAPVRMAARTSAPTATASSSKAEQIRAKMRSLKSSGTDPANEVELLILYGLAIGFKNRGAASSCVKANLEKY